MIINLNTQLPAYEKLEKCLLAPEGSENLKVQILILNLMPFKLETEYDLLYQLGHAQADVEVTWLHMASHQSKHTAQSHINAFYHSFEEVKDQYFDGLIVTGAALEHVPFEQVTYWSALQEILDWSVHHVKSSLFVCWGAHAALYHFFSVEKLLDEQKKFGVYTHTIAVPDLLFKGLGSTFSMPHSRYFETNISEETVPEGVEVLASSADPRIGVGVLKASRGNQIYITGHPEYPSTRLDNEYRRDLEKGLTITPAVGYYQEEDPNQAILFSWKEDAFYLFSNWVDAYVVPSRTE